MLTALKKLFSKKKFFVSEIDRFLADWDKSHSPSKAQWEEIKKYQRIFKLRGDR